MGIFSKTSVVVVACLWWTQSDAWAYDFTAVNEQGTVIYYNLLPGKRCSLTSDATYIKDRNNYYKGELIIPAEVEHDGEILKVTDIFEGAFMDCYDLTAIYLPETIQNIACEQYTFRDCKNLKKISFPSIEKLCSTSYPDILAQYTDHTLYIQGEQVDDVVIPEGITGINGFCIFSMANVQSVKIPNSLKKIRASFAGCKSLHSVYFPSLESLLELDYGEQTGCNPMLNGADVYIDGEHISELIIPDQYTNTLKAATLAGSNLTSVTLPSALKEIPTYFFYGCSRLEHIEIPSSVSIISTYAFSRCKSLKDISLPQSITGIYDEAFRDCTSLKEISFPRSVKEIGYGAFWGCSEIEEVVLPDRVTSVSPNIFEECSSLKTITLGKNVSLVKSDAFFGCPLETLKIRAEIPPSLWANALPDDLDFKLLVPRGSMEAYRNHYYWGLINEIEEFDVEDEETMEACAAPVIAYQDGKLVFHSETPNALYGYTITCTDHNQQDTFSDGIVNLNASYLISAYATADGYLQSPVTHATLCWLGTDPEIENSLGMVPAAAPILIRTQGQEIYIEGLNESDSIVFYSPDGTYLGSAAVNNEAARFETSEPMVIVKIGRHAIKVKI